MCQVSQQLPFRNPLYTVISTKVSKCQLFAPCFQSWNDITDIDFTCSQLRLEGQGVSYRCRKNIYHIPVENPSPTAVYGEAILWKYIRALSRDPWGGYEFTTRSWFAIVLHHRNLSPLLFLHSNQPNNATFTVTSRPAIFIYTRNSIRLTHYSTQQPTH